MARIVIADDDADIRELVVFKLRHGGHEVVPVGTAPPPSRPAPREKPDLVILDVMMPGMSGLDAARELRAGPRHGRLPIIMLTARAQESDIEQGFEAGADDYIVKPFSPRELASRVSAVLARTRLPARSPTALQPRHGNTRPLRVLSRSRHDAARLVAAAAAMAHLDAGSGSRPRAGATRRP